MYGISRYHNRRYSIICRIGCKCDRYKHVQSANIGVKCVTFVFETFTRYGSNITSVWQEILRQWFWHSLMKLCTKNYENPSMFVKVTAKKSVAPFFWTRCIFMLLSLSAFVWFLLKKLLACLVLWKQINVLNERLKLAMNWDECLFKMPQTAWA